MAFVTTLLAIIGLALVLVVVAALLSKAPPMADQRTPGTPPRDHEGDNDGAPSVPPER